MLKVPNRLKQKGTNKLETKDFCTEQRQSYGCKGLTWPKQSELLRGCEWGIRGVVVLRGNANQCQNFRVKSCQIRKKRHLLQHQLPFVNGDFFTNNRVFWTGHFVKNRVVILHKISGFSPWAVFRISISIFWGGNTPTSLILWSIGSWFFTKWLFQSSSHFVNKPTFTKFNWWPVVIPFLWRNLCSHFSSFYVSQLASPSLARQWRRRHEPLAPVQVERLRPWRVIRH